MAVSVYNQVWDLSEVAAENGIASVIERIHELQGQLSPAKVLDVRPRDFALELGAKHLLFVALGVLEHLANGDEESAVNMALQVAQTAAARVAFLDGELPGDGRIGYFGPN